MEITTQHPLYRTPILTPFSQELGAYHLREGFKLLFNTYPNDQTLACLFAQTALETGRFKKIQNNNFGNIKKLFSSLDQNLFTMFATGENLWDSKLNKTVYKWFEPPHIQTCFRHYEDPSEGAADYLALLGKRKRYLPAWNQALAGNAEQFSRELSKAVYYTADVEIYTKTLVSIYKEVLKKDFFNKIKDIKIEKESLTADIIDEEFIMNLVGVNNINSIDEMFKRNISDSMDEALEKEILELKPRKASWWKIF